MLRKQDQLLEFIHCFTLSLFWYGNAQSYWQYWLQNEASVETEYLICSSYAVFPRVGIFTSIHLNKVQHNVQLYLA